MIDNYLKRVNTNRYMRCINPDNVEDYVDIEISYGTNETDRNKILLASYVLCSRKTFWSMTNHKNPYKYFYLFALNEDTLLYERNENQFDIGNFFYLGEDEEMKTIIVDSRTNLIKWKGSFEKYVSDKEYIINNLNDKSS